MQPDYQRALPSAAVTASEIVCVTAFGRDLLATRLPDGDVVAFEAACPHQGQPLTRAEVTDDGCIECPFHFYAYDARTGRNVFPGDDADIRLPVYRTQERDGWVWIGRARR